MYRPTVVVPLSSQSPAIGIQPALAETILEGRCRQRRWCCYSADRRWTWPGCTGRWSRCRCRPSRRRWGSSRCLPGRRQTSCRQRPLLVAVRGDRTWKSSAGVQADRSCPPLMLLLPPAGRRPGVCLKLAPDPLGSGTMVPVAWARAIVRARCRRPVVDALLKTDVKGLVRCQRRVFVDRHVNLAG